MLDRSRLADRAAAQTNGPVLEQISAADYPRDAEAIHAVSIAVGKLAHEHEEGANRYVDIARRCGASERQIGEAAASQMRSRRLEIDRRTLLKVFGAAAAGAAASALLDIRPAAAATPTQYWGVDSVATVTQTVNGQSLRSFVRSIYAEAPNFWGRYFSSPGVSRVTYSNAEGNDLRSHGTNHVLPIQSPLQSRLNGTRQRGENDGMVVCQDITAKIGDNQGATRWPAQSPGLVFVFLDVEAGTTLSVDYWNGWADAVRHFPVSTNPFTNTPFRASMYCNPNLSGRCNRMANTDPPDAKPNGMWSTQPSSSAPPTCPPKLPDWDPANNRPFQCSSDIPAIFWQQALAQNYPNCLQMSATVGVDKDVVSPLGSPWLNRLLHLPLT